MHPMTVRGEKLLREELDRLVREERPRIIQAIARAREHGDLRENAEYNAAREQQAMVEGRIRVIEHRLASVRVIDIRTIPPSGKVIFGATVRLSARKGERALVYQIVGEDEADVENNKLSYTSPLAKALIGKSEGEEVTINPASGVDHYRIEKVEHI